MMHTARSALVAIAIFGGAASIPIASAFAQNPAQIDVVALTKAAEQGSAEAQNKLGIFYLENRKFAEAMTWYLKAAEQNHPEAQFVLGLLHASGSGTKQDFSKSLDWFQQASRQGHGEATYHVALQHSKGQGVPRASIQTAGEWMLLAAKQGYVNAQYDMGLMYILGEGFPQNYVNTIHWWSKAADQGHATAANNLALIYDEGRGGAPIDREIAIPLFRKAVALGNSDAAINLGVKHVKGTVVQQNHVLAYVLFKIASQLGSKDGPPSVKRMEAMLSDAQIAEGRALASSWVVGKPIPTTTKTWPQ
jgi:hypothetical protein